MFIGSRKKKERKLGEKISREEPRTSGLGFEFKWIQIIAECLNESSPLGSNASLSHSSGYLAAAMLLFFGGFVFIFDEIH